MNEVALRMLIGDANKYLGIVFGVAFASLLMAQQTSIFVGIMLRTTSQIRDVPDANLWIMDPQVRYVDDLRPLSDDDLLRVRGVAGVDWAVPFSKGLVQARKDTGDFRQVMLLGLDDATLVGAPRRMLHGRLADLRRPDAVIVDAAGFQLLWPGEPFRTGKVLEMSERRAVLVGICEASAPFQTWPILYTRCSNAARFAPRHRHAMSFILARAQPGVSPGEVCRRIAHRTGLQALTADEFGWKTVGYYFHSTGLPINFGVTVALGFLVGVAIAGQTLYLFTLAHLKQFAILKAMGLSNRGVVAMILVQATFVATVGHALGMGLTALFFETTGNFMHLRGLFLPWQVMAGTAVAVLLIVLLASLLSIRRVLVLEPAAVFRS